MNLIENIHQYYPKNISPFLDQHLYKSSDEYSQLLKRKEIRKAQLENFWRQFLNSVLQKDWEGVVSFNDLSDFWADNCFKIRISLITETFFTKSLIIHFSLLENLVFYYINEVKKDNNEFVSNNLFTAEDEVTNDLANKLTNLWEEISNEKIEILSENELFAIIPDISTFDSFLGEVTILEAYFTGHLF